MGHVSTFYLTRVTSFRPDRKQFQDNKKAPPRWNYFDLKLQQTVTEIGKEYSDILANAADNLDNIPKDTKTFEDPDFKAKVNELVPLILEVIKRVHWHLNQVDCYDPALIKNAFNVFINNHPAAVFLDLKTPSLNRLSYVILLHGRSLPLGRPESRMVIVSPLTSFITQSFLPNYRLFFIRIGGIKILPSANIITISTLSI
ncbi:hypothetical protein C2G38_2294548 [Gigaspora rosea]|uniref:Uncharacterized protein n=1 Tax=Gigaspora rosea TaxID=44941 RepID=A0A397WAN2_9GLOM|nr:hypothetical protein C2G38_2294548 [Gigaspora rosea]